MSTAAPVRAVALGRFVATAGGSGWLTIVVAHTREERAALAAEILANAFLPVVLVVIAATALLWLGIRRALAPLLTVEEHLRDREPADLSPSRPSPRMHPVVALKNSSGS